VVAGDAFLTTRSLDVLKELRSDQAHPLRLLINHANPYGTGCLGAQERTMSRCLVMAEKPKGKLSKAKLAEWSPCESIVDSINLFHSKLVADLKAGLKVVAVWGSRKAGQAFEAYLKEHFISAPERIAYATVIQRWVKWLKSAPKSRRSMYQPQFTSLLPNRFQYKFFHAGNKATSHELTDVNSKWAPLNYLGYSPTITVGVNYNPQDSAGKPTHCFNRLYIYACRYGATPRDLFQASLRVRVIQPPAGQHHLNYVIDHRGGAPPFAGLDNCQQRIRELSSANLSAHQQLKRLTKREHSQGLTFLPSGAELAKAPTWFPLLFSRNLNEANVSSSFPEEVYAHFLELCGYTTPDASPQFLGEEVLIDKLDQYTPYGDVAMISQDTAKALKVISSSVEESLTREQQLAINKFYFHERMGLPTFDWGFLVDRMKQHCESCKEKASTRNKVYCPHLPDWHGVPLAVPPEVTWPEWCSPDLLDLLWRGQVKCADPCPFAPKEGTPAHTCVTSDSADGYCDKASKFKHIALAKMATPQETLEQCLKMDFYDGGQSLDYALNNLGAKAQVMSLVVKELGLRHAGVAHAWTQEEFKEVIAKFTTERRWDDLDDTSALQGTSLIKRAMYVFGLRDRSGRSNAEKNASGKVKELSPPELLGEHLDMLFTSWCLSSVKVRKEHRLTKGGARTPHKVRPADAPTWNQVQGSPEYKALSATKGKSPEKVAEDKTAMAVMKVAWETKYPLETPLLGIELVPWQGLTGKGELAGDGLLWTLVPPYKASTAVTGYAMRDDDVE
jgi:hypothetical protein